MGLVLKLFSMVITNYLFVMFVFMLVQMKMRFAANTDCCSFNAIFFGSSALLNLVFHRLQM